MKNGLRSRPGIDPGLKGQLEEYRRADNWRGAWQVANTLLPLCFLWYAMYRSLEYAYWLTLVLALPTAGLLVRLFVLQHDLGHGALFSRRRVNHILGSACSVLTLVPFHYWRRIHALHHRHFGDLDRRGPGYLTTLTVNEYLARSPRLRLQYRLYRHPLVVVPLGGLYYFLLQHRFPSDAPRSWRKERRSVYLTNLGLLLLTTGLAWQIGAWALLQVHLPILVLYGAAAVWVFLNQHSHEETYWQRSPAWDFVRSSLDGSAYFKMPRILQWCTGNVGFHHVHHLSPQIPNYNLERCHHEVPELGKVPPLTLRQSFQTPSFSLWSEGLGKMVRFRDAVRSLNQVQSPSRAKISRGGFCAEEKRNER